MPFVRIIHTHNEYLTGIQLPLQTKIGKSLFFLHYSSIVINANAQIGNNCTIMQGVTIGANENLEGIAIIGNNVVLAAGCKIIGNIKIGDNVYVGANAVVTKDVPSNCVVAGVPARILNKDGLKYTSVYQPKNQIY